MIFIFNAAQQIARSSCSSVRGTDWIYFLKEDACDGKKNPKLRVRKVYLIVSYEMLVCNKECMPWICFLISGNLLLRFTLFRLHLV